VRRSWVYLGAVLALLLQGVRLPNPGEKGEAGFYPGGPALVLKEERKPLLQTPFLPPRAETHLPLKGKPRLSPLSFPSPPLPFTSSTGGSSWKGARPQAPKPAPKGRGAGKGQKEASPA